MHRRVQPANTTSSNAAAQQSAKFARKPCKSSSRTRRIQLRRSPRQVRIVACVHATSAMLHPPVCAANSLPSRPVLSQPSRSQGQAAWPERIEEAVWVALTIERWRAVRSGARRAAAVDAAGAGRMDAAVGALAVLLAEEGHGGQLRLRPRHLDGSGEARCMLHRMPPVVAGTEHEVFANSQNHHLRPDTYQVMCHTIARLPWPATIQACRPLWRARASSAHTSRAAPTSRATARNAAHLATPELHASPRGRRRGLPRPRAKRSLRDGGVQSMLLHPRHAIERRAAARWRRGRTGLWVVLRPGREHREVLARLLCAHYWYAGDSAGRVERRGGRAAVGARECERCGGRPCGKRSPRTVRDLHVSHAFVDALMTLACSSNLCVQR